MPSAAMECSFPAAISRCLPSTLGAMHIFFSLRRSLPFHRVSLTAAKFPFDTCRRVYGSSCVLRDICPRKKQRRVTSSASSPTRSVSCLVCVWLYFLFSGGRNAAIDVFGGLLIAPRIRANLRFEATSWVQAVPSSTRGIGFPLRDPSLEGDVTD